MEWLGHAVRMDGERALKKLMEGQSEGQKEKDIDDNELDRNVGVKRWWKRALDRREWATVMREAKVKLKGSYC